MSETCNTIWPKFIRKHWAMFVLWIVIAIGALIGAIYVLFWFVEDAQVTDLVPEILGLWSMKYLIDFLLHLLFWEIILVGIPLIIIVALIYLLWWKKLPYDELTEYRERKLFGKSSRTRDSGTGISLLINIGFIIKVYLDGNWDKPFAEWKFDYLIHSYLTVLGWLLLIFGIPILIGTAWWIWHKMKKAD
jgi:hypothetical protein